MSLKHIITLTSKLCRTNLNQQQTKLIPATWSGTSFSNRRFLSDVISKEKQISDILQKGFPKAGSIKVEDISGGCGAMFDVFIEAEEFQGKKLVQQHMMVTKTLKSEIQDMHGIRISTKAL